MPESDMEDSTRRPVAGLVHLRRWSLVIGHSLVISHSQRNHDESSLSQRRSHDATVSHNGAGSSGPGGPGAGTGLRRRRQERRQPRAGGQVQNTGGDRAAAAPRRLSTPRNGPRSRARSSTTAIRPRTTASSRRNGRAQGQGRLPGRRHGGFHLARQSRQQGRRRMW